MQTDVILKRLGIQELNQMQKSTVKAAGNRNDVMVLSPTGSGKTIAFLLPVFEKLENENKVQTLIIVPARELALQIEQVFKKMTTEYKVSVCYGGHDKKSEINELAQNPAVVIATPGRLAYHMREKSFNPAAVHTLVLDEFDKALELGFEDDMRIIVSSLKQPFQTILTSATQLAHFPDFINTDNQTVLDFLKSDTSAPKLTFKRVSTISEEKLDTLFELLCEIGNEKCLVFCNHREATDRISALLKSKGIARETFHGGMEQDERERALIKFRNGSSNILLTTDL
ncbi:MAG TPA: helicase, partial [Chryseobacterium sp.]|nr:helicase [Chryseobacterium sp.]